VACRGDLVLPMGEWVDDELEIDLFPAFRGHY
jgi:hypothetical protein